MPDKQIISLLLAFSMLGAVIVSPQFKERFENDNISISVSENKKMISLTAKYPKANAQRVHAFIREHLHLGDLPDMGRVDLKDYETPDGFMSMDIKSRNGYLKVVMQKRINDRTAYDRIRSAVEGIKNILAGK